MSRNEHLRMCTACRKQFPQKELFRIVRSPIGEIFLDEKGKANGRGAYVCKDVTCIQKAQKQHSLERSLRCKIPEELMETLKASCH